MSAKLISRAEYEDLMLKTDPKTCLLCDLQLQIVLGESEHWCWIACLSPYWPYHTMFIPRRHVENILDLSTQEFSDLKSFYTTVTKHLNSLNLEHADGKPVDQFILMIRTRKQNIEGGSTYRKPSHLHIHLSPDREGVEYLHLDPSAVFCDIKSIALLKEGA